MLDLEHELISCITQFEKKHIVPILIRRRMNEVKSEWIYSCSFVNLLKQSCAIKYLRKEDRIKIIKQMLDFYSVGTIDTVTAHSILICLYHVSIGGIYPDDDLREKDIGQKRMIIFSNIPDICILSDEDFFALQLKGI